MPITCQDIMKAMEHWAPAALAEEWDKIGLMVGNPSQLVKKAWTTLDVTLAVAEAAATEGVDMIISHHPLIFKPIYQIDTSSEQGKVLQVLFSHNIAVFSAHTNLDCAAGGINDVLAARLELEDVKPFIEGKPEPFLKLVTYVPPKQLLSVWEAVTSSGAGHIGKYSHSTFAAEGVGSFLPLSGTSPFSGEIGKIERCAEIRLETILPARIRHKVIAALLAAHPYEEVAYDLYPVERQETALGLGRIGTVPTQSLTEFAGWVKRRLGLSSVSIVGVSSQRIRRVAVCGGSGAEFFKEARALEADVLVTGDIKYHDALDAKAAGIAMIDAGHYGTESLVVPVMAAYLQDCFSEIVILANPIQKDVFQVY